MTFFRANRIQLGPGSNKERKSKMRDFVSNEFIKKLCQYIKKGIQTLIDNHIRRLTKNVTGELQKIHSDLSNAVISLSDESESTQYPEITKDLRNGMKNVQDACDEAIESLGLSEKAAKDESSTMDAKRKQEAGLDDDRMTKAVKRETSTLTGD